MATTKGFDHSAVLAELVVIADAVKASSKVNNEVRGLGNRLTKTVEFLDRDVALLVANVATDENTVRSVINMLNDWAVEVAPSATFAWKSDETNAKIDILVNLDKLGILTPEQSATLNGVRETLRSVTKRGNGVRNRDGSSVKIIEGNALRVIATDVNGDKITTTKANTAQSHINLTGALIKHYEKAGQTLTAEDVKALREYAKRACQGETVAIGSGSSTITLTPEFE